MLSIGTCTYTDLGFRDVAAISLEAKHHSARVGWRYRMLQVYRKGSSGSFRNVWGFQMPVATFARGLNGVQWRWRTYFEVVVYSVRTMPIELKALGVAGFSQCAM